MAQHCITCGRELRDSDAYCASCGAVPVKAVPPQAQPERWEVCEITWSKKKGFFAKWHFWARNLETGEPVVTGKKEFVPSGTTYGASQPDAGARGTVPAFDEVVDLLREAGWEPVAASGSSGGSGRWDPQFRRPV
jgi:hypothetical protein